MILEKNSCEKKNYLTEFNVHIDIVLIEYMLCGKIVLF